MEQGALIEKYFTQLTSDQIKKFEALYGLYSFWNEQINVISRKDMEAFYERHVLHSLGIARFHTFAPQTKILDVGTGGGFPGIPLAILFPECQFTLVDSIGKKIKVVTEVAAELGLDNVEAYHQRAEKTNGKFHYVVSRAVTRMNGFIPWVRDKFESKDIDKLGNGIIYLKGGDLEEELAETRRSYQLEELSTHFEEAFFETKKVVYIPM